MYISSLITKSQMLSIASLAPLAKLLTYVTEMVKLAGIYDNSNYDMTSSSNLVSTKFNLEMI